MTRKIVVAALVVVFAHPALAHEVDCEKQVGILRTDAGGQVFLAEDGSPAFAVAPDTILEVDSYPVTIGWRLTRTDAFVARYDAAGNLLWSKQLGAGAPLSEDLSDIVVDAAGYGVATGSIDGPDPVHGGILSANVVLLRIALDGTY